MNLSTLLQLRNLSIENIITRLYENGDVAPPTPQRPVVPLHHLIRDQGLKHVELSNLSSRAAMNSLVGQGALTEAWRGANSEALAGFLYANENGVWIFVRREDSIARRRFCAAHELGHYVLHFPRLLAQLGELSKVELIELLPLPPNPQADELSQGKLILQGSASDFAPTPDPDEMEHEADSFATELLMPEAIVRALAAPFMPHCSDVDLARRLSTEMLVSRASMLVRLRHLGLLRGEASLLD
jgi:Zn-dependent peptidase ImmA (M78 family)